MRRGDVVTMAAPGDYGKPRPAVVVQSDRLQDSESVILCPLTSFERDAPLFRLRVEPTEASGLRERSQIMVEKVSAIRRSRCGPVIGRIDRDTLATLDRLLAFALGLADEPA